MRALCSSNGVLDVYGGLVSNGTNVRLWYANSMDAQAWTVSHDKAGYLTLTNVKSGKVLDASGGLGRQGDNVVQWTSNAGWNQKWVAVPLKSGGVRLVSGLGPDLSLDVCGGAGKAGDNIDVWGSDDSGAQAFSFEETLTEREWLNDLAAKNANTLKSGTYVVKALCSKRCVLDIYNGSKADAANVQIWESNNGANQKWKVAVDGSGYVTLVNVASGKALDASGGTGLQGDNVIQWSSNGGWNQKWVAVPEDNGIRLYSAVRRGICLDVCGGNGRQGDNVELWGSNKSGAQFFRSLTLIRGFPLAKRMLWATAGITLSLRAPAERLSMSTELLGRLTPTYSVGAAMAGRARLSGSHTPMATSLLLMPDLAWRLMSPTLTYLAALMLLSGQTTLRKRIGSSR